MLRALPRHTKCQVGSHTPEPWTLDADPTPTGGGSPEPGAMAASSLLLGPRLQLGGSHSHACLAAELAKLCPPSALSCCENEGCVDRLKHSRCHAAEPPSSSRMTSTKIAHSSEQNLTPLPCTAGICPPHHPQQGLRLNLPDHLTCCTALHETDHAREHSSSSSSSSVVLLARAQPALPDRP